MSGVSETQPVNATVDDVAKHFGVSTRTVRRWLKDAGIPHRRLGGKIIRFNIDEVNAWAKSEEGETSDR